MYTFCSTICFTGPDSAKVSECLIIATLLGRVQQKARVMPCIASVSLSHYPRCGSQVFRGHYDAETRLRLVVDPHEFGRSPCSASGTS